MYKRGIIYVVGLIALCTACFFQG